jgi:osmotically-inducible protein OsmY
MKPISRFSAILAAAAMSVAMGCASTSTSESTGEYIDDTAITAKVKTAIFNDETLKTNDISVETYKGRVQLSGYVDSSANIAQAGVVAKGIGGVTSVKNDLRLVEPTHETMRGLALVRWLRRCCSAWLPAACRA